MPVVGYSGAPLLLVSVLGLAIAMIVLAVFLARRGPEEPEETLAAPDDVPDDEYLSRRRLR